VEQAGADGLYSRQHVDAGGGRRVGVGAVPELPDVVEPPGGHGAVAPDGEAVIAASGGAGDLPDAVRGDRRGPARPAAVTDLTSVVQAPRASRGTRTVHHQPVVVLGVDDVAHPVAIDVADGEALVPDQRRAGTGLEHLAPEGAVVPLDVDADRFPAALEGYHVGPAVPVHVARLDWLGWSSAG
jgi:hypothetical protein